jgi:K+-transporting ATPase ATPase C chain
MKEHIFPAIKLTIICLLFFSGVYTLLVLGIAQLSPSKGNAVIITSNGKSYYQNIGQKFTQDNYFWSRPSAVDYNAAGAGGSNKGPTNPDYLAQVNARIDSFMVHNPGIEKSQLPSDLVTASGSGLDPHISVEAAQVQIKRISKARGIPEPNIYQLVLAHTEAPLLGLFGTSRINVLELNLALDNLK